MTSIDPFEERTIYTIDNENGQQTTITLNKLTADVLQKILPDVHAWVQNTYNKVTSKKPELSRREKGDLVRVLANNEAQKSPEYKEMIDSLI